MGTALVIGETVMDIVETPDGRVVEHPGGSAANVSVALARLGRPVRLATSWGPDSRGARLERHLRRSDVTFAGHPVTETRTSSAFARIAADGSARYEFDVSWQVPPIPRHQPRVVHIASLAAMLEPGAEQVRGLLRDRRFGYAPMTYDINARPELLGLTRPLQYQVEEMCSMATVVKVSDEDLRWLYPGTATPLAARRVLDLGPQVVALTRGSAGCTWFSKNCEVSIEAEPVEVVDTIAAGDTFMAALIDALWTHGLLDRPADVASPIVKAVLSYAARAAAITVSRPGADPPRRHEMT